MKSQNVKIIRFAIIKLFFAILFLTGTSTLPVNSPALTIRHHPIEILKEDPFTQVRHVLDSRVPTAFTIDGMDSVVMVPADEYFQLVNRTTKIGALPYR